MKFRKFLIAGVGLLFTLPVAAEECHDDCDMQRLIRKCREIQDGGQIEDLELRVMCRGSRTSWRRAGTGTVDLATRMNVVNKVKMKGGRYQVPEADYRVPSDDFPAECPVYEEISAEIPNIQVTLDSCQELEDMQRMGRDAFCQDVIDNNGGIDMSDALPTGRTHTFCEPGSGTGTGTGGLGAEIDTIVVRLQDGREVNRLKIRTLETSGVLARAGVNAGDMIFEVGTTPATSVDVLKRVITNLQNNGERSIRLYVWKTSENSFRELFLQVGSSPVVW